MATIHGTLNYISERRLLLTKLALIALFGGIIARLMYWQILSKDQLQALAQIQRQTTIEIPADRGQILAADEFPLVSNQPAFLAYVYLPSVDEDPHTIAQNLAPIITPTPEDINATPSAKLEDELLEQTESLLIEKMTQTELSWVPLKRNLTENQKQKIESYNYAGIGFETYQVRHYPEASMAAQLVGFVGSNGNGQPMGYFGLEGHYDLELKGKPGLIRQEKDIGGNPIIIGDYLDVKPRPGRTLKTHINRGIQRLVELKLKDSLETYQAISGEVIIMNPKTGAVTSLAAFPKYDPQNYTQFDQSTYAIPAISHSYEPGSTFKAIVMAAAIDTGVVTPKTQCFNRCNGPVTIGHYTIRTWNNEYHPGLTMTDVLRHSDNTGMIYTAQELGKENFKKYLKKFGFGQTTNIDLEGEAVPRIRETWGDIDLATGSFGQGIAVTSMQMVKALGAIANDGVMMQPQVVDTVISQEGEVEIKPKEEGRVISEKAAQEISDMLVAAAEAGEAQWAIPQGYNIAGKTGTAQIPIRGHYDTEKTIASFIGFAPAHDPQFVMLVKLQEPQTSPWASETAAPVWFSIAKDLFNFLNIQPQSSP